MGGRVQVSRGIWVLLAGVGVMGAVTIARSGRTAGEVWDVLWPWAVVLAAAGFHELGHIAAAWGIGVGIRGLKLDLFGARMELAGLLSYGQEFFVAAGGPLVSLMCAAVAYPLAVTRDGEWFSLFFGASLVLGLVNLLPVGTMDGGRMLRSGAAWLWGDRTATALLRGTTVIILGLLWMLSVYGLLRAGQMLSLFAFSLCLLVRAVSGNQ